MRLLTFRSGKMLPDPVRAAKLDRLASVLDIDASGRFRCSPLMCAARAGLASVVEKLLSNASDMDVNMKDETGNTALHLAVRSGSCAAVKALLR